jgi:LEA14-like dessication related protein
MTWLSSQTISRNLEHFLEPILEFINIMWDKRSTHKPYFWILIKIRNKYQQYETISNTLKYIKSA